MRELLGDYAQGFNDRHRREGHLFQGRFHTRVVTRQVHHLELHRYLALNPVRARLCSSPEVFRWSAHGPLLGFVEAPAFLDTSLAAFDGDRVRYAAFVAAASGDDLGDLLGDGALPRLWAARDAGYTQAQIASALGVTQQTVSDRLRA